MEEVVKDPQYYNVNCITSAALTMVLKVKYVSNTENMHSVQKNGLCDCDTVLYIILLDH